MKTFISLLLFVFIFVAIQPLYAINKERLQKLTKEELAEDIKSIEGVTDAKWINANTIQVTLSPSQLDKMSES